MTGLTLNDAALLYCILGEPDPNDRNARVYPTVDEALAYMRPKKRSGSSVNSETKKTEESVVYEQLTFM